MRTGVEASDVVYNVAADTCEVAGSLNKSKARVITASAKTVAAVTI